MANILIVGTATDGPVNEVQKISSLGQLLNTFGGDYTEIVTLSPTATSHVLDFTPQGKVSNSNTFNKKDILYFPSLEGNTYYFGSVGGTGLNVHLTYTPYLGDSDLINAARYSLENGAGSVNVMRIGGAASSLSASGWVFQATMRGSKYDNITITTTASSLTVGGLLPSFPVKTYTGDFETIVTQINTDAHAGFSPVFVSDWTTTIPILNAENLAGGDNGVVDYASLYEFLDHGGTSSDISHVVVLGNLTNNISQLLSDTMADDMNQTRLYFFQTPDLTVPYLYRGATNAETYFYAENTELTKQTFDALTHGSHPTSLLTCTISPTGAMVFDKTQTGYTALKTYSGNKAFQLYPSNTTSVLTLTAPASSKIQSIGFWVPRGSDVMRVKGYDNSTLVSSATGLTGVASGTAQFLGVQFKKPMDYVTIDCLSSGSASGVVLDDVGIALVPAAGGNLDDIFAYIKELQIRHPNIATIAGSIDISVDGEIFRTNAVNALPPTLTKSDGLLTNQSIRGEGLYPIYSGLELNLATLNGINVPRRWINKDLAVHQGVVTDSTTKFTFASKSTDITRIAATFLRQFLGKQLKQGNQQMIATELRNKVSVVPEVTIIEVLVDYTDGLMRAYIEGSIYGEIMKISFTVKNG
jgi:hypothetical protein